MGLLRNRYPLPDPPTKLWRYVGFADLIYLLSRKTLHFTRADKFEDRFEGSSSTHHIRKLVRAHPSIEAEFNELQWQEDRRAVALSCWHMSEYESLAMWRLYANRGLAIQTTYDRLDRSIVDPAGVVPGLVEYADHRTTPMMIPNVTANFFRKRPSFSYEQEFRLAIYKHSGKYIGPGGVEVVHDSNVGASHDFMLTQGGVPEDGLDIQIDPDVLIEAIYVAPDCPPWTRETVVQLVSSLGCKAPARQSDLDADPIK
jgi:hypothetical protein